MNFSLGVSFWKQVLRLFLKLGGLKFRPWDDWRLYLFWISAISSSPPTVIRYSFGYLINFYAFFATILCCLLCRTYFLAFVFRSKTRQTKWKSIRIQGKRNSMPFDKKFVVALSENSKKNLERGKRESLHWNKIKLHFKKCCVMPSSVSCCCTPYPFRLFHFTVRIPRIPLFF